MKEKKGANVYYRDLEGRVIANTTIVLYDILIITLLSRFSSSFHLLKNKLYYLSQKRGKDIEMIMNQE
jgi:hypothetical protein